MGQTAVTSEKFMKAINGFYKNLKYRAEHEVVRDYTEATLWRGVLKATILVVLLYVLAIVSLGLN